MSYYNNYKDFIHFCETWDLNKCWVWPYGTSDYGYGIVYNSGKLHLTHRLSFELFNNIKLNKNNIIRHSCDNPPCFNPNHLFEGDHNDNGRSKLCEDEVLTIFYSELSWAHLAHIFEVDRKTIEYIKIKKNWKYLTKDL